jgi:predicted nuclease of predicted toxin-antitoxin system
LRVRFLLDMNLSPVLAARLRQQGHDALHAMDAGYGDLPDGEIFRRAAQDHRIVITFDLDFGNIAAATGDPATSVILLRLKLTRPSYLWDRLQVAIGQTGDAFQAGVIVLVEDARIRVRRTRPED